MVQIIDDSVAAFCEGRNFKRSNMEVAVLADRVVMWQHGNLIALRPLEDGLYKTTISNAGWYSVTTKARLDALLDKITQGAWGLHSARGDWVLYTRKHGESLTFKGSVKVQELIDLDNTIQAERDARAI